MPRIAKETGRKYTLGVSLSAAEDKAVREAADAAGLSVSTGLRRIVAGATAGFTDFGAMGVRGTGPGEGGSRDRVDFGTTGKSFAERRKARLKAYAEDGLKVAVEGEGVLGG